MSVAETSRDRDLVVIEAAVARRDRNVAIDAAIRALGRGLEDSLILRLVADGLEEDGRLDDAAHLLQRATDANPDDVEGHAAFGRVLAKLDMPVKALEAYERALTIDPDFYPSLIGAGMVQLTLGAENQSRDLYLRAAAARPADGEPLSALAVIAARQGDAVRARSFGERALILRPDFVSAQISVARADLAENAPQAALDRLRPMLARPDIDPEHRADAMSYVADALDALDRSEEAFPLYQERNALLGAMHRPRQRGDVRETAADQVRRLTAYFIAAPDDPWRGSPGQDRRGGQTVRRHLFLLGFPRSGTTLLENVLSSHPQIDALEEREALSQAGAHLMTSDAALSRLAILTETGADVCRAVYWDRVKDVMSADMATKTFIDKLPLHSIKLPLIAKLFPSANIIMALRDPRDVVLSCFRRRFFLNAAMAEFLTLEGAANYYDQVMRLTEVYRARLPLRIETVRHEDLVSNFDIETQRVLGYCGVEWDPCVHDFAGRATGSRTPSALQVRRGLNAEGVGQWRRYRDALAPVLPLLAPWAARFGYPID